MRTGATWRRQIKASDERELGSSGSPCLTRLTFGESDGFTSCLWTLAVMSTTRAMRYFSGCRRRLLLLEQPLLRQLAQPLVTSDHEPRECNSMSDVTVQIQFSSARDILASWRSRTAGTCAPCSAALLKIGSARPRGRAPPRPSRAPPPVVPHRLVMVIGRTQFDVGEECLLHCARRM